ncbi:hypothetical protein [Streptomyces broussonetiae]|uniref:Secreted protein n=1 Tax=Streptomyces broussonetiae TaxID=2686304 RepID=A0ABV5EDU0_9ACTN
MISTRRIVAAVGLAAGVAGLAAPMAGAAEAGAKGTGKLSPLAVVDSLQVKDMPTRYRDALPLPSQQVNQLNRLKELNQLGQVTGLVSPVFGLVPAVK